jgi:hypothetical protein
MPHHVFLLSGAALRVHAAGPPPGLPGLADGTALVLHLIPRPLNICAAETFPEFTPGDQVEFVSKRFDYIRQQFDPNST